MRRRHEPRGWHARRPPVGGAFQFQIFFQTPSPEMWSETISGSEEGPGGEVGWPVFGLPPWKKYRRCDRAHLVPPNAGWMRQSLAVRRRAILSVGTREVLGSETTRVHIAARRCGGVAAWPLG